MPLDFCLAHKNELQVHRLLVEHMSVTHIPVIVFKFYPFLDVYGHPVVKSVFTQNHSLEQATETYKAGSAAVLTERKDRKDVTKGCEGHTLWAGVVASQWKLFDEIHFTQK